jgi:hypothetical protein
VERIPSVVLNGDPDRRYIGNLNFSFAYVEGESLLMVSCWLYVRCCRAPFQNLLRRSAACAFFMSHAMGVFTATVISLQTSK